jgi:hypothetical protein
MICKRAQDTSSLLAPVRFCCSGVDWRRAIFLCIQQNPPHADSTLLQTIMFAPEPSRRQCVFTSTFHDMHTQTIRTVGTRSCSCFAIPGKNPRSHTQGNSETTTSCQAELMHNTSQIMSKCNFCIRLAKSTIPCRSSKMTCPEQDLPHQCKVTPFPVPKWP